MMKKSERQKGKWMRRAYKRRLYPTARQVAFLSERLGGACRLHSAAPQDRRDAWRMRRIAPNSSDQANQLKEICANADPALADCGCRQHVLRRTDKTFNAFCRRVKRPKGKAGFPRFKSHRRVDGFQKVEAAGTSQERRRRSGVRKTLATRWRRCAACGLSEARDHVSSKIILRRGTPPLCAKRLSGGVRTSSRCAGAGGVVTTFAFQKTGGIHGVLPEGRRSLKNMSFGLKDKVFSEFGSLRTGT
jgi:transposase